MQWTDIKKSSFAPGRGVFAKKSFLRGDVVLTEEPFFVSPPLGWKTDKNTYRRIADWMVDRGLKGHAWTAALLEGKLIHLSEMSTKEEISLGWFLVNETFTSMDKEEVQRVSIKLAGFTARSDDPYLDRLTRLASRFQHNSLPLSMNMGFANAYGMFETGSRIQHSCRPNLRYSPGATQGSLVFHAVGHIAAGEELTINYCGGDVPDAVSRSCVRAFLEERMGFECKCCACVA